MSTGPTNTFVANTRAKSAEVNQNFSDCFPTAAMTAYVPTWEGSITNPNIGNGTLAGSYEQHGKWVIFEVHFIFGGTSANGTGTYYWGLPVAADSTNWLFSAKVLDSGTKHYVCVASLQNTARFAIYNEGNTGSGMTNNTPITWAPNDTLNVSGIYKAA